MVLERGGLSNRQRGTEDVWCGGTEWGKEGRMYALNCTVYAKTGGEERAASEREGRGARGRQTHFHSVLL